MRTAKSQKGGGASRSGSAVQPLPQKRRYDAVKNPDKVFEDARLLVSTMRRREHMPFFDEFYRLGYQSLFWALREFSYHHVAERLGLPADPSYYQYRSNLDEEITRIFLRPQWRTAREDEEVDRKWKLPDYRDLQEHPDLSQGVARIGGISQVFPPNRQFCSVEPSYYFDLENLKVELQMVMKLKRTKLLPTYAQVKEHNPLLPDIYLLHGGYFKVATLLELQPNKVHLREPENLRRELDLIEIARAKKEGERTLENGLPDCYLSFIPSEEELREARRTDLHRAIIAMGGYYHAAKQMHLSLHATFWRENPSLRDEMRRVASRMGRPLFLPTADELMELDRKDLAMAIKHNGGLRRTAELCGLRLPKTTKRSEASLHAISDQRGFIPYPERRFHGELERVVDGWRVLFEVSADAKIGRGRVEEFGLWFADASSESSLRGRFGWVRRRPGERYLWMHRLEGDAHWSGAFADDDLDAAIRAILNATKIQLAKPDLGGVAKAGSCKPIKTRQVSRY